MSKIEFCIYGKEGCGYCEQRYEQAYKFKERYENINISVKYKDTGTGNGLADLMCLDNVDPEIIPIVTLSVDDEIVAIWQGYEKDKLPTTRKFVDILTEEGVI